jgi:hypothetical protein
MARDKAVLDNIDGSDLLNFPNKRIRNNDGSGNGTPVDEVVYGDIHEFFAKVMRDSNTAYNGLPDNVSNGYQYFNALMQIAGKNDLIKNITVLDSTTLDIPIKIGILKVDETLIFKSNFDSVNGPRETTTYNQIKGTDSVTKALSIAGHFKAGDYVRVVNTGSQMIVFGLYDSINVPNLVGRLNTLEAAIQPMIKKLSVFQSGGGMLLWNKPAALIPTGWAEVVDWRGRFPVGMDVTQTEFAVLGGQDGSKDRTLLASNLPPHSHTYQRYNEGVGSRFNYESVGDDAHADWENQNTGNGPGTATPFSILNPYRVVLFIEYIL